MSWLRRRIVIVSGAFLALACAMLLLTRPQGAVQISVLTVWKEKDGSWYTTLLLSNKLDVPLGFEWLDSEDRDLKDKRGEKLLVSNLSVPSMLSPREAVNFALILPPPGVARRFRLYYFTEDQQESRFHALLRSLHLAGEWRPRGSVASSPEVSANNAPNRK